MGKPAVTRRKVVMSVSVPMSVEFLLETAEDAPFDVTTDWEIYNVRVTSAPSLATVRESMGSDDWEELSKLALAAPDLKR